MKTKLVLIALLVVPIFGVRAQTVFSEDGGIYTEMLTGLKSELNETFPRKVTLGGQERTMFISWVRDHIHTMKAYKYWEKDMSSYIDFFMERPNANGMYFDYAMSYKRNNVGQLYFTNVFDNQFYFVDVLEQLFFFRMPIEGDLEYLMCEGVYTNWQTTGDKAYLEKWLPVLAKGMRYEMTDPLRWSDEYLLVKRPYSIDTWDFTSEPDSLKDTERLLYHIGNDENTPKGIMHGDNSGMYSACIQLSEMYSAIGQDEAAREWGLQAELFRERMNNLCWNGRYYAHFIPIDPVPAHIKMDPIEGLSLSNTYDMNRGAPTVEMSGSIIEAYIKVEKETADESLAAWYGIYPFIEPQFGKYDTGVYVNGAILPLVGGELTKAAFTYGHEEFAVEQLKKLHLLMEMNDGNVHGCFNRDGTPQTEAIPDEWGQAAFVSALIEGLAGVVDKDIQFRKIEIAPRWIFADINEMKVEVGYGGDGNHLSYDYKYKPSNKNMEIFTSGKFEEFIIRLPYPEGTSSAIANLNGKNVNTETENINGSRYAVVTGSGSKNKVVIQFK